MDFCALTKHKLYMVGLGKKYKSRVSKKRKGGIWITHLGDSLTNSYIRIN